jgi:dienelactone hydrolase
VIIPDIFGWNGGRTRNIADYFALNGFFVMVPKLLAPPLEGGVDGDGLPPNFEMNIRGGEIGPFIKSFPWEGDL